MDDARSAPIVSPADAEEFFATGYNALTCEPDVAREPASELAAITVDVPAVGATPSSELPSLLRDADGSDASFRAMVEAASADDFFVRLTPDDILEMQLADREEKNRDRVLGEMLFAARDLAEENIAGIVQKWCRRCQMTERGGRLEHAPSCNTGRVLRALLDLAAVVKTKGGQQ